MDLRSFFTIPVFTAGLFFFSAGLVSPAFARNESSVSEVPENLKILYCKNQVANRNPAEIKIHLLTPQKFLTVFGAGAIPKIFSSTDVKVQVVKGLERTRTEGFTYVKYISPAGELFLRVRDSDTLYYAEWRASEKQPEMFSCTTGLMKP